MQVRQLSIIAWIGLLAGLLLTATSALAARDKPDLKRIFAFSASENFQTPVIVIHGAFGARIRNTDNGKEIWPGSQANLLFSNYDTLALSIDPVTLQARPGKTEAYALFDKTGGHDFYGKIIKVLRQAGGYVAGVPGQLHRAGTHAYYIFVYDWRQDIPANAIRLDELIEQIRNDYNDPGMKVDIVAHSMGGLVTRYYMRYGREDVLGRKLPPPSFTGGHKLRKVVLIGTPNLGSISGLQNFLTGYKLGLGAIRTETIATMPGAYQLMPNPQRSWMITPSGKKADVRLYDAETWKKFRWSVFDPDARARITRRFRRSEDARQYLDTLERYFARQLVRARRFHHALSIPLKDSPVRYIVFGGDCELTPARCLIETVRGKTVIRLNPKNIHNRVSGIDYRKLMLEPGDGRVTKPSLLARNSLDPSAPGSSRDVFPLAYPMFLCERHSQLTGNISFQDNLLNILLLQETTEDRMQQH